MVDNEHFEKILRSAIRNDIVRKNRLPGPLSSDAERMLEKCADIELENLKWEQEVGCNIPYYHPTGGDE